MKRRIRVLLVKPTHDCHDRGVRYLARKLSDAGMEVVFANFLLPAEIVTLALQESVDVVGISSSSGGHMPVFRDVIEGMAENDMTDVLLIGGGVIPPADVRALEREGVAAVFGPGATAEAAIELLRSHADVM